MARQHMRDVLIFSIKQMSISNIIFLKHVDAVIIIFVIWSVCLLGMISGVLCPNEDHHHHPSTSPLSSSSLCSHNVPWMDEGLSMLLPHLPILSYPLPDGTLPVVVYFVSPTSRQSSSRSLPFVGFPGDTRCLSVISFSAARVHFRFLTGLIKDL